VIAEWLCAGARSEQQCLNYATSVDLSKLYVTEAKDQRPVRVRRNQQRKDLNGGQVQGGTNGGQLLMRICRGSHRSVSESRCRLTAHLNLACSTTYVLERTQAMLTRNIDASHYIQMSVQGRQNHGI
jgi:hypothetical protein